MGGSRYLHLGTGGLERELFGQEPPAQPTLTGCLRWTRCARAAWASPHLSPTATQEGTEASRGHELVGNSHPRAGSALESPLQLPAGNDFPPPGGHSLTHGSCSVSRERGAGQVLCPEFGRPKHEGLCYVGEPPPQKCSPSLSPPPRGCPGHADLPWTTGVPSSWGGVHVPRECNGLTHTRPWSTGRLTPISTPSTPPTSLPREPRGEPSPSLSRTLWVSRVRDDSPRAETVLFVEVTCARGKLPQRASPRTRRLRGTPPHTLPSTSLSRKAATWGQARGQDMPPSHVPWTHTKLTVPTVSCGGRSR